MNHGGKICCELRTVGGQLQVAQYILPSVSRLSLSLFCLRRDRSQNCEMREVWKITLESSFFSNGPSLIFSIHKWSTAPANLCVALAIALTLDILSPSLANTLIHATFSFPLFSPCKMRFSDGSCSSSQKNNSTVSFSLPS